MSTHKKRLHSFLVVQVESVLKKNRRTKKNNATKNRETAGFSVRCGAIHLLAVRGNPQLAVKPCVREMEPILLFSCLVSNQKAENNKKTPGVPIISVGEYTNAVLFMRFSLYIFGAVASCDTQDLYSWVFCIFFLSTSGSIYVDTTNHN